MGLPGPENIKVRGSARPSTNATCSCARDASAAGDRVLAENYYRSTPMHYFRVLRALQPSRPVSRDRPARTGRPGLRHRFRKDETGAQAAAILAAQQAEAEAIAQREARQRENEERQREPREPRGEWRDRDDREHAREPREPREPREYPRRSRPSADGGSPRRRPPGTAANAGERRRGRARPPLRGRGGGEGEAPIDASDPAPEAEPREERPRAEAAPREDRPAARAPSPPRRDRLRRRLDRPAGLPDPFDRAPPPLPPKRPRPSPRRLRPPSAALAPQGRDARRRGLIDAPVNGPVSALRREGA